jgi:Methyltransferase domain
MERRELVASVVSKIPNGVFVEIGTFNGDFACHILDSSENSTLYCVDPYISYMDYEDSLNNTVGDDMFNEVSERLKSKYGDRVVFIRKLSTEALSEIPDEIDVVYIDGNHRYSYVSKDLILYYSKVKKGGYVIANDAVDLDESRRNQKGDVFIEWSPECYGNYGVVKAFREFCIINRLESKIVENQYIIQKKMSSS